MNMMNTDKILFDEISMLIVQSRRAIYAQANSATVLLFWKIGQRINVEILQNKRADYGKQIVSALPTQLSWTHIVEILPLKTQEAKSLSSSPSHIPNSADGRTPALASAFSIAFRFISVSSSARDHPRPRGE